MSSIGRDTHGVDFNTVYSAFYPRILRYLARLVGPDEAEDISQEVFIKISRSLGNYRGEGISSWVYRIATNAAMDRSGAPVRSRFRPKRSQWRRISPRLPNSI